MAITGKYSSSIIVAMIAAIICAAGGVYANILLNGFVYDDYLQILNNPWLTSPAGIKEIFSHDVWGFSSDQAQKHNFYRPMMHLVYLVVYRFFEYRPWGYHLVSIVLNMGVSMLVFLIGRKLLPDETNHSAPPWLYPPFVAAILFAVHPIHVEAVAWAAGQPELLYTFFCLASLYLYIRAHENGTPGGPFSSLAPALLFFCAALSKETALVFPVIIVSYDYLYLKPKYTVSTVLYRFAPFVLSCAGYFLLRFNALGAAVSAGLHKDVTAVQFIINVPCLLFRYLGKLVLPINQNVAYEPDIVRSLFDTQALVAVPALIALSAAVLYYRKSSVILLSACIILTPLAPAMYAPAISNTFADRYLYLPSFGFTLLAALLIARLSEQYGRTLLTSAWVCLAVAYAYGTVNRNEVWRSELSLWADVVDKSPNLDIAHTNYGIALKDNWRLKEAAEEFKKAIAINPAAFIAYDALGVTLMKQANYPEATIFLREAARINPSYVDAHLDLGKALMAQGDLDGALHHLTTARRLEPENPAVRHFLTEALRRQERKTGSR